MNTDLEHELKLFLISTLALEDITAEDIQRDMSLFGDGLGLDSVDALEIGVAIQKRYGVKINASDADTKTHFASIKNLAEFISAAQSQPGEKV